MNRYSPISHLSLLLIMAVMLLAGCNNVQREPDTPYQIDNEKFFNSFEGKAEYHKLLFANEDYPIYYKVIQEAPAANKGIRPIQNSTVKVHVEGKLMSGEYFQRKTDNPTVMEIFNPEGSANTIKGFRIALQNMEVGSTWEVVIPWQLGYGRYSTGYIIPGYSTLIFTIELLEIVNK